MKTSLLLLLACLACLACLAQARSPPPRRCVPLFKGECGGSPSLGSARVKRVVGGDLVTQPGRWPWYVQVLPVCVPRYLVHTTEGVYEEWSGKSRGDKWQVCARCGGSLIHKNWVLTAGHCADHDLYCERQCGSSNYWFEQMLRDEYPRIENKTVVSIEFSPLFGHWLNAGSVKDRSGDRNWGTRMFSDAASGEQSRVSQESFTHPNYIVYEGLGTTRSDGDMALIHVEQAFDLTDTVAPACVPAVEAGCAPAPDATCWLAGNGDHHSWDDTDQLREARVQFLSRRECQEKLSGLCSEQLVPDTDRVCKLGEDEVCSADDTTTYTACSGDSGGPLVCRSSGKWWLQGAVQDVYASGDEMCSPDGFNTHAKVTYFRRWIQDTITKVEGNSNSFNPAAGRSANLL